YEGETGSETDVTSRATWTSSDPQIINVYSAAVEGIRAVGSGDCTVTAKYKNKEYTCTIKVEAADSVSKVVLTIDNENREVREKRYEDVSLTAVYNSGKEVDVTSQATWSSSKEDVLSTTKGPAAAGKVYGASEGKVTLSATYKEKTAEMEVTVNPEYNMVETGFNASTNMEKTPGTKHVVVDFTCTDQKILDLYLKENEEAIAEDEEPPYEISSETVNARISYETDVDTMTYSFTKLPGTLEELQTMPLDDMFDPMAANILAIATMDEETITYGNGFDASYDMYNLPIYEMFDWINGPNDSTELSKDQMSDAYSSMIDMIKTANGNGRYCYFKGASPQTGYDPEYPYEFTLEESPYILGEMEGVAIANYPERHMILVSFAGQDSQRYCDVYHSSDGNWYSWFKSWRNLVSTIKQEWIYW
ncbi:MAG: hypothetical protein IJ679_05070, partial [Lachnospiraceae bacterium]|nr:hypothetical protein [Lachnospiraceae bacterium]